MRTFVKESLQDYSNGETEQDMGKQEYKFFKLIQAIQISGCPHLAAWLRNVDSVDRYSEREIQAFEIRYLQILLHIYYREQKWNDFIHSLVPKNLF